jgi:hypothetical protein
MGRRIFGHGDGPLGRALIFRLVAEQLAVDPRYGGELDPFQAIRTVLL